MEDFVYLGTGSRFSTPAHSCTSKVIRLSNGDQWLYNCGEGTQTKMMESHGRHGKVRKIFISDLSNDKICGLPGLLCSLGAAHRTQTGELTDEEKLAAESCVSAKKVKIDEKIEPKISRERDTETTAKVEIYGPVGLKSYIRLMLRISEAFLSYNIFIHELDDKPHIANSQDQNDQMLKSSNPILTSMGSFITKETKHWQESTSSVDINLTPKFQDQLGGFKISSTDRCEVQAYAYLESSLPPTFGYVFTTHPKIGKLDVAKLKKDGLKPGRYYGILKSGQQVVNEDGTVFLPEDYISASTPGKFLIFSTHLFSNDKIKTNCWLPKILSKREENFNNNIILTINNKSLEGTRGQIKEILTNLSENAKSLQIVVDYFTDENYEKFKETIDKDRNSCFENEKISSIDQCSFGMIKVVR